MMRILRNSLFFLICFSLLAQDMGQALPDQLEENYLENVEASKNDPFAPGSMTDNFFEHIDEDLDTYFLPNKSPQMNSEITEKDRLNSPEQSLSGQMAQGQYLEFKKSDLTRNLHKHVKDNYSIEYYKDNFEYKNSENNFEKVFRSETASAYGILRVSWDRFIYKGFIFLSGGIGAGVGFNSGKGIFTSDGEVIESNIMLWTIPVDLSLKLELPVSDWFRLYVGGGPSVMGLIQHRQDKNDGARDKEIRQYSYGYFANAGVKINLGKIFSGSTFNFYKTYGIGQFHLNLMARTQNYSNFQDEDVEISGQSFGAGFSFDFI